VSQRPLARFGAGLVAPLVPTRVSGAELERGAVVPPLPAMSPLVPVDGIPGAGAERRFEPDCTWAIAEADSSTPAAQRYFSFIIGLLLWKELHSPAAFDKWKAGTAEGS
jgi:hypothetical protein